MYKLHATVEDCCSGTKLSGLRHFFSQDIEHIDVLESTSKPIVQTLYKGKERCDPGPRLMGRKYTPKHLEKLKTFSEKDRLLRHLTPENEVGHVGGKENKTDKSSDYDSGSDVEVTLNDNVVLVTNVEDEIFDTAIQQLNACSVVGLGMEGICLGRFGTLCWVQAATYAEIYLFDIVSLGPDCFAKGLKSFLENPDVLKVVHDCRQLSDLCYHQYDTHLVNVFDTQVADVIVYRLFHGDWPRFVQGLSACLFSHLNIIAEKHYLQKVRHHMRKEDQEVWRKRPMHRELYDILVKNVQHLRQLRLVLMEKMMAEYVAGVDVYLSSSRNASDCEAAKLGKDTHLLPLAFNNLWNIMCRHTPRRTLQRDENGFVENCTGLKDPDVQYSRDGFWHHKGPHERSGYISDPEFSTRRDSYRAKSSSYSRSPSKELQEYPRMFRELVLATGNGSYAMNPSPKKKSISPRMEHVPATNRSNGDMESPSVSKAHAGRERSEPNGNLYMNRSEIIGANDIRTIGNHMEAQGESCILGNNMETIDDGDMILGRDNKASCIDNHSADYNYQNTELDNDLTRRNIEIIENGIETTKEDYKATEDDVTTTEDHGKKAEEEDKRGDVESDSQLSIGQRIQRMLSKDPSLKEKTRSEDRFSLIPAGVMLGSRKKKAPPEPEVRQSNHMHQYYRGRQGYHNGYQHHQPGNSSSSSLSSLSSLSSSIHTDNPVFDLKHKYRPREEEEEDWVQEDDKLDEETACRPETIRSRLGRFFIQETDDIHRNMSGRSDFIKTEPNQNHETRYQKSQQNQNHETGMLWSKNHVQASNAGQGISKSCLSDSYSSSEFDSDSSLSQLNNTLQSQGSQCSRLKQLQMLRKAVANQ